MDSSSDQPQATELEEPQLYEPQELRILDEQAKSGREEPEIGWRHDQSEV